MNEIEHLFMCLLEYAESVFCLFFCYNDLSICVSGVLKSPTIIVLLSISLFMSVVEVPALLVGM